MSGRKWYWEIEGHGDQHSEVGFSLGRAQANNLAAIAEALRALVEQGETQDMDTKRQWIAAIYRSVEARVTPPAPAPALSEIDRTYVDRCRKKAEQKGDAAALLTGRDIRLLVEIIDRLTGAGEGER